MFANLSRLLEVPTTADPDDARRRKILNILIIAIAVLTVGTVLAIVAVQLPGGGVIYGAVAVTLPALAVIYLLNRYRSGPLASILFLLTLILAFASDTPKEVVEGRTLFMFAIPIMMSSALLRPWASFATAGGVGALILIVAYRAGLTPNIIAILAFVAIALVSWLSARTLEDALHGMEAVNAKLETRVQDRTRDLSEALLHEQTEARKSQAILQSIADGVIVFDETGHATVANPAINGLLERPASRIMGATLEQLMDTVPADHQIQVQALFAADAPQADSTQVVWGDKTLSLRVAPLKQSDEKTTGAVAVFRDVTREAEISRMKSMLVAMVSHELRTPLGAIEGLAEVLQEGIYGHLADKQQQTVTRIVLNAKRLIGLVGDLLDQAQIEAGTVRLELTSFTSHEFIEAVHDATAEAARQKGLQLVTLLDLSAPENLVGDLSRLSQIAINLIGNAIKFTEQGKVEVRLYQPDSTHWALEVADTGRGIPISAEAYIYDPFRQVDGSVGRRHGGIGLGLSIVKRLVTLMSGEIKLSSRIGRGSTFTVILPLEPVILPSN